MPRIANKFDLVLVNRYESSQVLGMTASFILGDSTPVTEYRLVVGVLGIVFDEDSEAEAKRQFDLFVSQSKTTRSASTGTSVTLFRNQEIIAEYHPPRCGEACGGPG
jgi:hypothetical protein